MMRVLTPNGNVIEVEKAEAIVEKRVGFNGRDIRLCQTAKDKSQPASGLYFSVKSPDFQTIQYWFCPPVPLPPADSQMSFVP